MGSLFDKIRNASGRKLMLAAAFVGAAAAAGRIAYDNREKSAAEIEQQNHEILFPGPYSTLGRAAATWWPETELFWLARHQKMMQDTANVRQFENWLTQFDSLKTMTKQEKLTAITRLSDRDIEYAFDFRVYGRGDYNAAPLQTINIKHGDCDDFTIWQYYAALRAGFEDSKTFFLIGSTDSTVAINHVVLAVDTSGPEEKEFKPENIFILGNSGYMTTLKDYTFWPVKAVNATSTRLVHYKEPTLPSGPAR